ncbi:methyl-accepting chemotaxis protein [Pseudooceanicola sp. 502str34]
MRLHHVRLALLLPAALVTVSALLLGAMGVLSSQTARESLLAKELAAMELETQARADRLSLWFEQFESELAFFADSPGVADAARAFQGVRPGAVAIEGGAPASLTRVMERYDPFLQRLREAHDLDELLLVAPTGDVLYSTSGDAVPEAAVSAALRRALAEGAAQSGARLQMETLSAEAGPAILGFAPVQNPFGAPQGILVFRVDGSSLRKHLPQSGRSAVLLIGPDGTSVGAPPVTAGAQIGSVIGAETGAPSGSGVVLTPDGEAVAWASVAQARGWRVASRRELSEILSTAGEVRQRMFFYGGGTVALFALFGAVLSRYLLRPLGRQRAAMEAIARGDAAQSVPDTHRGDELGAMARGLDAVRQAQAAAAKIAAENRFKGAALETTTAALMMTDADFNVIYLNGAIREMMEQLSGDFSRVVKDFSPESLIGRNMDGFHADPGRIRGLLDDPAKLPFRTDIPIGNARLQIDVSAVRDGDGTLVGMVIEWVDVTSERRDQAVLAAIENNQVKAEFDLSGRLVGTNANFLQCCGVDEETLRRLSFADWIVDTGSTPEIAPLRERLGKGAAVHGRFCLTPGATSSVKFVEGGFSPVLNRKGGAAGFVLIGSDVTEAQQHLAAGEAARQRMEADQHAVVESLRVGLRNMSDGDLSVRLMTPFSEEYEGLRRDFNEALQRLGDALRDIALETISMQQETGEISKAADEMSRRTERQALTLQSTAVRLDEVTKHVAGAAEGATRADRVVAEARDSAERSGTVVDEAEGAMAAIATSSREVVKVVEVIEDIAFQTSLLALNAGVEAARAGEAGRGFAVVATEVRALAQRCSNAAAEIGTLISSSGRHVDRGVALVGQTGEALKRIVGSITEIADYIGEVARAGEEQSLGLAEVNRAVTQIDQVTQETAAMFEETNSAAHALADRAQGLARTAEHFRLDGTDAGDVPGARPSRRREAS